MQQPSALGEAWKPLPSYSWSSVPRTVNGTGHTGPSEFCATAAGAIYLAHEQVQGGRLRVGRVPRVEEHVHPPEAFGEGEAYKHSQQSSKNFGMMQSGRRTGFVENREAARTYWCQQNPRQVREAAVLPNCLLSSVLQAAR